MKPNETLEEAIERQKVVEQDSVSLGIARYRAEKAMPWQKKDPPSKKEEADLSPGKYLLSQYVEPVAAALEKFLLDAEAGKAVHKSTAAQYLIHVEPLQAAYLALRNALNSATDGASFSLTARRIGDAIQEHLEMVKMGQEHPGLYRKVSRQLARSTSAVHRLGVLRHVREKYELTRMGWSIKDRIHVGAKMIEFLLDTGLFEVRRMNRGRNDRPQMFYLSEETAEWLEKAHGRCELLSPIHLPMVCPPRRWRTPFSGGYRTDLMRVRLVHTRNRDYLNDLGGVDLSEVMDAVNAIQSTGWRINRKVLGVMLEEMERGGARAGLPPQGDLPLPPRPAGIAENTPASQMTASQKEAFTEWKARAAKVHSENASNKCERMVLAQKLYVAQRFAEESVIYFPHYLDFRGRVYPMASYLNPQADDTGRGLLEFAEGKPLGQDGAFWLAAHIAGLWGVDKVSFAERVEWVMSNEEAILDSAMDPLADGAFWTTAEKPWQALAACIDWLGYKVNGDAHVSHTPIAMDGSCSGLQHYSALLRDEVGGAAVNLVPGEKPSDIYTMVSNRAQVLSDGCLQGTNDDMARAWAGKFCRKVAKQPTMTLCYSATKFGMKQQIENALRKLDEDGPFLPPEVDRYKAAIYAADIIWEALGDVVVAARRAMGWLKAVSDIAVEADVPLRWTSPVGLPVLQDYREIDSRRLIVFVGGKRMDLRLTTDSTKRSKRRQASGIAPNFVHSLDAAHLLSTVNLGVVNGLRSFAVIHDSFAVHAADTSLLNAVLREAFVIQYSQPVFEEFREELVAQLEVLRPDLVEAIPPLPARGDLDLGAVKDSEFFFA